MGLFCVAAWLLADVPEVAPEKLPEVTPIDVPALLGGPEEPEPTGEPPPEEEGLRPLRNRLSACGVLTDELVLQNTYRLVYEHYLGKKFVEKGQPLDLAPFLQKCGLIEIELDAELDTSLEPQASWAFSSVRHGGEGPFQFRFGLLARQDSWSPSYAYKAGLGAGASLYLGPYLKLGYLYYYMRAMDEFQYAFDEGHYEDSDLHAVDAALAVRLGRQYLLLEGEARSATAEELAKLEDWLATLSYYPASRFCLSGRYSKSDGSEGYGAGLSSYLGRRLGVSVMWTTTEGNASLFDTRVLLRF